MTKQKTTPKDFFLHLLNIVTLYITAISFGRLLFLFINFYFPDQLSYFNYYNLFDSLRWSTSSLIVAFPIYLFVSKYLQKDISDSKTKKLPTIINWLLYLTLFITAIVIIITLMSVIFKFLGGEITLRFILKVFVVLVISGLIFGYYLYILRSTKINRKIIITLALLTSLMILMSIVVSFLIMGGPTTQRLREFDRQRIEDLASLQSEIIFYYQDTGQLPQNISELNNNFYTVPKDPESGENYEYITKNENSFELCANFKTSKPADSPQIDRPRPSVKNLSIYEQEIEPGKNCFQYTIPDRF